MSIIEILTAISLFCPILVSDDWDYSQKIKVNQANPKCVAKAWKCVDRARKPLPQGKSNCWIFTKAGTHNSEMDHWVRIPDCRDPVDFEKCFR